MNILDIAVRLSWRLLSSTKIDVDIKVGYTSDLLSDVMGNAPAESVFITIQAHKNTVAVASLAGLSAILLCSNRQAPQDMIAAADQEGIPIYQTEENQFWASYHLGKLLNLH
jgi:hypothetical protein